VARGNSTEPRARVSHVAQNEYGLCLLATRDLDTGIVVAHFDGDVVPYEEVPEDEIPYVLNLGNGGWMIPSSTEAREANHSCDPNCMIDGQLDLVTVRPVGAGEELTFSYVMVDRGQYERSMEDFFWDERWTFDCRCGSPNCVGRVDRYLFSDEA
jgi:SET domain-containing protein